MKKIILLFVLISFLLVGCIGNQVYKNLEYQDSIVVKGDTTVYIFTNEGGEKVLLYDGLDSSYKNLLDKGRKYDVEVSLKDTWTLPDYIHGINKSK